MLKFNSNVSSVYTLRQFLDFVQGVFQKSLKIEIFCVYAFIILIWTKGWNFTFVTSGLNRKSFKILFELQMFMMFVVFILLNPFENRTMHYRDIGV